MPDQRRIPDQFVAAPPGWRAYSVTADGELVSTAVAGWRVRTYDDGEIDVEAMESSPFESSCLICSSEAAYPVGVYGPGDEPDADAVEDVVEAQRRDRERAAAQRRGGGMSGDHDDQAPAAAERAEAILDELGESSIEPTLDEWDPDE